MAASPSVFISFASGDAELAHRALETLERAGIRCWIADRDIKPATSYPAAITAAIKSSGTLLLLLTEAANASPHVLREVELAFTARRPILPVRIAGATPSLDLQYFLSTSQWLDAGRAFDDEDLTRIEPVLRDLLARGSVASDIAGPEQRRWIRPAAAVASIVFAAAALAWFLSTRSSDPAPPGAAPPTPASPVASNRSTEATPRASTPAPPAAIPPTVNRRDGQIYVWIAPGRFVMGCSEGDPGCDGDEKPVHEVRISRGFWLARTEVTVAQYRKLGSAGQVSASNNSGRQLPVTEVSWADAKAYCARIGGRLPTEAEWEFAARGGSRTRYYDTPDAIAWFTANSHDHPHPVAEKTPNALGLYDMLGNVSEWVLDRYYNAYDETSDPLAPDQPLAGNASAVARGGSWISELAGIRVSRRLELPPEAKEPHIGFRCAADQVP